MSLRWRVALVGLVGCAVGLWLAPTALLATWLAAWWFLIGIALGALVNLWLHDLTGGRWGEPVLEPLAQLGALVPLLALLFLPVLLGLHALYPWSETAQAARWSGEASAPGFLRVWLSPLFFVVRTLAYLVLWSWLAWMSMRRRRAGFAAFALIAYAFSVSFAATDWIMSLQPLWRSSVFGLLVGTGQALSGLALAVMMAAWRRPAHGAQTPSNQYDARNFRDLGNLLLMYVLTWAYLAFVQYLIIWAENLPHEISWYLPRVGGAWLPVTWALIVLHFAAPLVILLFRDVKERTRWLALTAAVLLGSHLLDAFWQVLPSVPALSVHAAWLAPVTLVTLGAIVIGPLAHRSNATPMSSSSGEARHA